MEGGDTPGAQAEVRSVAVVAGAVGAEVGDGDRVLRDAPHPAARAHDGGGPRGLKPVCSGSRPGLDLGLDTLQPPV